MKESQSLCQAQRNRYVYEIRTLSCKKDERWDCDMWEINEKQNWWESLWVNITHQNW